MASMAQTASTTNPLSDHTTHQLDNGLQVILQPTRAAPVASFWLWYRVGSRNEVPGLTGLSHWVEHMLFKGTEPTRAASSTRPCRVPAASLTA